ncbi:MAG: DUF1289 domain-containing protein [Bacteroidales bacterium]|nr:DUF1289 domain-containing protein [Bacteroidales bacterium]
MMLRKKIKSPCQLICIYDEDRVCIGCYRTQEEVVNWDRYTDEEKLQVLRNTAERRQEKQGSDYYGLG